MNYTKRVFYPPVTGYSATSTAFRDRWCEILRSEMRHEFDAADHLMYLAMMGIDWRAAFSPISRLAKLKNGCRPYQAAAQALAIVHITYRDAEWIERFNGSLTQEMLTAMRARLPKVTHDMGDTLPDAPYLEVTDGDAASAA
jgi:hypothetical protein